MDNKNLLTLNSLILRSYECRSFEDFLRLAITGLHTLVMYDSGLFFCAISRDSSFFQPYIGGSVEDYYKKTPFPERDAYLGQNESSGAEAVVYKAVEYQKGLVSVPDEPRSEFLSTQAEYHVACIRIVYHGQFMGEIYLHRNQDKPDFNDRELFVLRLLQPHISCVFHIIHSLTAVKLLESDKKGLDKKGLCLFDSEGNLVSGNVTGLELLNNSTVFGSSVFYHLKEIMIDFYAANAQLSLHSQLKNSAACRFETLKTPGGELLADIFITGRSRRSGNHRFCVTLEFADETQSVAEYKFKFTKREADIIDGVIQGKSNPKIAAALDVSENTVKTHLQNIFRKSGVRTRAELVYILMLNRKKD